MRQLDCKKNLTHLDGQHGRLVFCGDGTAAPDMTLQKSESDSMPLRRGGTYREAMANTAIKNCLEAAIFCDECQ